MKWSLALYSKQVNCAFLLVDYIINTVSQCKFIVSCSSHYTLYTAYIIRLSISTEVSIFYISMSASSQHSLHLYYWLIIPHATYCPVSQSVSPSFVLSATCLKDGACSECKYTNC